MLKGVNWIAVLIAFVLLEVLGYLWYGLVFSSAWLAEMTAIGLKPDMSSAGQTRSIAEGAVLIIIQVIGLSWLLRRLGASSLQAGLTAGFAAWFFFGLTTQGMEYVYMGFTPKLMAINCGQLALAYVLAGAVLGGVKFGASAGAPAAA
ncbi:MAG: hypothetical protein JWP28_2817 [Phenylobacterium sp.]|uniref:DUF1761 domain-containing protein n=1 Tax=Phenylobacterium sp. TaxID=1871053 RepID=UPI0026022BE9|nr:DUF1761 domain-containing protein [Phenylobacterium sp.]MDB5462251.1 hypothetical protein [Phenylobacterium sp.]MDB5498786.1 hypothetical protein [Phenylobacterium sp.]